MLVSIGARVCTTIKVLLKVRVMIDALYFYVFLRDSFMLYYRK